MDTRNQDKPEALNFCFNCGAKMENRFKFCPNCGEKAVTGLRNEPAKVVPISPDARRAIEAFETRYEELKLKTAKRRSGSSSRISEPNITFLVVAGVFFFALLYFIFNLILNNLNSRIPT